MSSKLISFKVNQRDAVGCLCRKKKHIADTVGVSLALIIIK